MKISKLFHWLYASVMFIPIFILPIFALAVRSDNNFQPMSITVNDSAFVPIYESNQVNSNEDLIEGNIYLVNEFYINAYNDYKYSINFLNVSEFNFENIDYSVEEFFVDNYDVNNYNRISLSYNSDSVNMLFSNDNGFVNIYFEFFDLSSQLHFSNCIIQLGDNFSDFLQFLDDTQQLVTFEYTNYNVYEFVENIPIVYNDTDVGSQMVYTLYNATDKYFNFNQFLGIGKLFDWFQLNVFNGNAPLGFIIVWNLLIYWLLVSIVWLIFDIAMYVPKLAHRWLDKASLE